jgi:ribose transport system substrate-binding protein
MKRTMLALAATLGAGALLTACTPAVSSNASQASPSLSPAQSECAAAVKPDVEKASAPLELVAPATSLDLGELEGKSIWYIAVGMNQFATDMADGVEAAGAALGLKVTLFDGQNQTNRFNEGIDQAVAQGADGIILLGIDPKVVANSLQKAEAAGIPVQNTLNGDAGDEVPAGTYGNLTSDYTADGAAAAKWAMIDSGCAANVLILSSSGVPVWEKFSNGAVTALEESCPDCASEVLNIDAANVATSIGSQLQTALQRNPEINYILPAWDSAVPFTTPVLTASGSDAKVMGRDGIEASISMISKQNGQDMTVAMPPTAWIGYISVDDLARAVLGLKQPGYVVPTSIIDSANVGSGSSEDIAPNYVGFAEKFEAAWTGK